MIFRFTKKAQEKLKLKQITSVEESEDLFNEWYVNIFTVNRHKYILTTNAATLFSVIMHGTGIKDDSDYFDFIFPQIKEQMDEFGCEFWFKKYIAGNTKEIIISNTVNRSVLGSMNDIVKMAEYMIKYDELPPFDASKDINKSPFGYIKMHYPYEKIKQYKGASNNH